MQPKDEIDTALESLSREKGYLVYGVLWSSGQPFLVHEDPEATLGIHA